jgi:hypothetical protein
MTETESLCTSCRQEERLRHLMVLLACKMISLSASHPTVTVSILTSALQQILGLLLFGESRDDIKARVRKYEKVYISEYA